MAIIPLFPSLLNKKKKEVEEPVLNEFFVSSKDVQRKNI